MALCPDPQALGVEHKRLLPEVLAVRVPFQPAPEPGVHGFAAFDVVVVPVVELRPLRLLRRAQQLVHFADSRAFLFRHVRSPVSGRRDKRQRPRRGARGYLGVIRADPEAWGVLAQATALHIRRHHVHGHGGADPVVNSSEQKRLRPSARAARCTDSCGVHLGQAAEVVHGPDAVPELQPHRADAPLPALRVVGELPVIRRLRRVVVADHVISENDVALARQIHPDRHQIAPAGRGRCRRRRRDRLIGGDMQTPHLLMPVRVCHSRERALHAFGPIDASAQVVARHRLDCYVLDRVIGLVYAAGYDGTKRGSWRHRPQTRADEYLHPQVFGPRFPLPSAHWRTEFVVCVRVP